MIFTWNNTKNFNVTLLQNGVWFLWCIKMFQQFNLISLSPSCLLC